MANKLQIENHVEVETFENENYRNCEDGEAVGEDVVEGEEEESADGERCVLRRADVEEEHQFVFVEGLPIVFKKLLIWRFRLFDLLFIGI